MRRRKIVWLVMVLAIVAAVVIVSMPPKGELAYLRKFHPREFDFESGPVQDHVLEFQIPFALMRARLDERWGKGKEIAPTEVCYRMSKSIDSSRVAFLDAGRFDADFSTTTGGEPYCHLSLTHYQASWIARQIRAMRQWLHLE